LLKFKISSYGLFNILLIFAILNKLVRNCSSKFCLNVVVLPCHDSIKNMGSSSILHTNSACPFTLIRGIKGPEPPLDATTFNLHNDFFSQTKTWFFCLCYFCEVLNAPHKFYFWKVVVPSCVIFPLLYCNIYTQLCSLIQWIYQQQQLYEFQNKQKIQQWSARDWKDIEWK
jgi:hypothetical protein